MQTSLSTFFLQTAGSGYDLGISRLAGKRGEATSVNDWTSVLARMKGIAFDGILE